jgi:dolichol-phosphate mannosyltransferase
MTIPMFAFVPASAPYAEGPARDRADPILLSVVIPTFNERANVEALLAALSAALAGIAWEAILVDDDSPDGTWSAVKLLSHQDARVRCLRRVGRRGLAGACIEGILSSSAPFVAVMDGDMQHDETVLPAMLQAFQLDGADVAVGTRNTESANRAAMSPLRWWVSQLGRSVWRLALRSSIEDPMSGFFMIRRALVEEMAPRLSTEGFKILADILITAPRPLKIMEMPYVFRPRLDGKSKFSLLVALQYAGFVIHKVSGGLIPVRFVLFGTVGICGLAVHLLVLRFALISVKGISFFSAQLIATYVAMSGNFLLNNKLTFRDHRYRGSRAAIAFLAFCLVCSVGTIANANLASWVFASRPTWWAAGLAGALVSAVWNYAASQTFVWPKRV